MNIKNLFSNFSKENLLNLFLLPWNNTFYLGSFIISSFVFIIGATTYTFSYQKNKNKFKIPQKWVKVGIIDSLFIYPIKSCSGIQVDNIIATSIGFKSSRLCRDRVFMVVDRKGKSLCQILCPGMALINVIIMENQITLNHPLHESITITIPIKNTNDLRTYGKQCRVYLDPTILAMDCGDIVGNWLENVLKISGLRLYFHNLETSQRKHLTNFQKKFSMMSISDKGAFQDEASYMMMTIESLNFLNDKLQNSVPIQNFRPNIVLKQTPESFSEESWNFIRIGDKSIGPIFKICMPCTRCKQTTVDQITGTFYQNGQPLKTLNSFKRKVGDYKTNSIVNNLPVLGVHLGLYSQGEFPIKSGDSVYAAVF